MSEVERPESVFRRSPDVVAREIAGELILVPLVAGVGDLDGDVYTLNPPARAVWNLIDGQRSLADIVRELEARFAASEGAIEADVRGIVGELARRKILVDTGA